MKINVYCLSYCNTGNRRKLVPFPGAIIDLFHWLATPKSRYTYLTFCIFTSVGRNLEEKYIDKGGAL